MVESISTDTPSGYSKADKNALLDIHTAEYVAPSYQTIVELWSSNSKNKKSFVKLLSYS